MRRRCSRSNSSPGTAERKLILLEKTHSILCYHKHELSLIRTFAFLQSRLFSPFYIRVYRVVPSVVAETNVIFDHPPPCGSNIWRARIPFFTSYQLRLGAIMRKRYLLPSVRNHCLKKKSYQLCERNVNEFFYRARVSSMQKELKSIRNQKTQWSLNNSTDDRDTSVVASVLMSSVDCMRVCDHRCSD